MSKKLSNYEEDSDVFGSANDLEDSIPNLIK